MKRVTERTDRKRTKAQAYEVRAQIDDRDGRSAHAGRHQALENREQGALADVSRKRAHGHESERPERARHKKADRLQQKKRERESGQYSQLQPFVVRKKPRGQRAAAIDADQTG